ncbi:endonuclease domain-containing protein [Demequina lutea]|uniref:Very-short-patch-repair endonuclease n=1 Tax=Demequina lutea TaxID=431489 RepID=A0A7Y9ZBM3_9MICO|nr:DUF559 domain-containing protein [Demequina lutea]NYI42186.1 very-short-patch-repair endonuclease [Demequina lutea]
MRNNDAVTLVETLKRTPHAHDRHAIERRWPRAALRAAVRSGAVTRLLPTLYAATEHAESTLTRAHAATTWVGSGSVVIGAAAASAWELCEPPRVITVTAPLSMSRAVPPWLSLKRLAERPPSALWHGCPVAMPGWAIATAYGHLPRHQADEMVYRAVRRGLATPGEIGEVAASLSSVRHRRELESTLAAAAAGSESYLETVGLRAVFSTNDFAGFIRQHRVLADGASYRLDMYDPVTRTAVELDGAVAHGGAGQRERDARRDVRLASIGIVTLRFVYRDLTERPAWCRAMVTSATARRGVARVGMSGDSDASHAFEWA